MLRSLHGRMLIGGLLGIALGVLAHFTLAGEPALDGFIRYVTQPIGQIFLRLLFMLVIPLIFSALALGITGLGDLKSLGRIGLKTLAYTVGVSAIAVMIGLFLVNTLRPGDGLSDESRQRLLASAGQRASGLSQTATAPKAGLDLLIQIVPDNPIRSAANGDMLGVMF